MKIYIDFSKQAITKIDSDVAYVGDVYSNVFELLFFNYGDNADWFPTMSQLAPNGREAGDFSADALEENETYNYVEDGVTYKRYTFTIGDGWVRMKGRSNFFIWVNKLVDSNTSLQRKCYGKLNVALNESTDNYFIQDAYLNPKIKEYIDNTVEDAVEDKIDDLVGGEPKVVDTAAHILAYTENKGICLGSDTGHYYYWNGTGYVDGGVYLSNYGLYYATFTDSDISSFDSEYISGGSITTPTYNVLECDLEASFIAKLTSDDYTLGIDFDTLGDDEDIDFVVSGFAYLTKTSKATGTYTYDFISDLPITATVSKFISQRDNERVCVSFIHITGTDATKYFILIERMLDYEIVEIDNSSLVSGYKEYEFRIAITEGSSCLGATIKPVLHQIIDGVEQETNLITLIPTAEIELNGATVSVDGNGGVGFYTANGGSVTANTEIKIARVLLPVGNYSYKLTADFTILTGHANFGCGLKTVEATASDSYLIQVSHDFTTTLATATEAATASIEVPNEPALIIRKEYTPIIERGNCVLRFKQGTTILGTTLSYDLDFKHDSKMVNFLNNGYTVVTFTANNSMALSYGSFTTISLVRTGDSYGIFTYTDLPLYSYDWDSDYGILYYNNNDVSLPLFSTDTTPTEDSTNPIQSGAVYTSLGLKADKSTTYTKTEVDTALNLKADKATTYTKTEVDNKIADISAYSKSEIDTMLNAKADASDLSALDLEVDGLANDITDLKAVQNVVDVVATKSALDSYVTTKLETNDKIQVIADETHGGASTIYNWTGSAWSYVGAFGGNAYTKTQVDTLLEAKANQSTTYTKTEVDTALSAKADLSNSLQSIFAYSVTAQSVLSANTGLTVGTAFSTAGYLGIVKDENSDKYQLFRYKSGTTTKIDIPEATGIMALTSDIATAVSGKADASTTYTKTEVDTLLSSKSSVVANPTLAGTESDLTGLEVNGVKYAVPQGSGGGSLYLHKIRLIKNSVNSTSGGEYGTSLALFASITTSSNTALTFADFQTLFKLSGSGGINYGINITGKILINNAACPIIAANCYSTNRLNIILYNGSDWTQKNLVFDSVNTFEDTVTQV